MTPDDVLDLVQRLRGPQPGGAGPYAKRLLQEAADALEALLPSRYLVPDAATDSLENPGWNRPEEAVPDDGNMRDLLPITAWDVTWAARRGDEVRQFPDMKDAEAWLEEVEEDT